MKSSQIMTREVIHCYTDTTLQEAAMLMSDQGCGALPVFDGATDGHVIGIITDRDIVCRAIATGADPTTTRVDSCMSYPVVTVGAEDDVDDCRQALGNHRVRRAPVVDQDGCCRGIISQADIARHVEAGTAGRLLKTLSKPDPEVPPRF